MDILKGLISYAISSVTGKPRPLSTNASDELLVSIGSSGSTQDVNLVEIDGTAPSPNVAGHLPVESDVRQIAGTNIAATTVAGTLPVETDQRKIAGNVIATTGVSGTSPIEGPQATDTAVLGYPVPIGGETVETPDQKADNKFWNLITDRYRRLWVRNPAYNSSTSSDDVTNLNLDSTNRDTVEQLIASYTSLGAGTINYPSDNGQAIGDMNKISWVASLTNSTLDMEISNDQSVWVPCTKSLIDHEQARHGLDNTHYTGTDDFGLSFQDDCKFQYYRFPITFTGAGQVVLIKSFSRSV